MDMVNSPSRLNPNTDFFTRLLKAKSDIFEIVMYKIHIAGRKMEKSSSTSEVYTKYRILDIQETLIDYGLGMFSPSFTPPLFPKFIPLSQIPHNTNSTQLTLPSKQKQHTLASRQTST